MDISKIVSLKDLYFMDFELENIFVMRQIWKQDTIFRMTDKRPSTGFVFLNKANGIYTDISGESFEAKRKNVVCLPQGSIYTCLNGECTTTLDDAVLVQFNIIKGGQTLTLSDKPFLVRDINMSMAAELFDSCAMVCNSAAPSAFEIKTAVYRLLLYLCKEKVQKYQNRFSVIGSGIELLEGNFLCELTVEEIAKECNVTPCYFRRLFKEYSGKSPHEYRMDMRFNAAKRMIESGESTLTYIAEALKFESVSYFCRMFKKKYGVTPGEYKNMLK